HRSPSISVFLFMHDLDRKTGTHFSGSCIFLCMILIGKPVPTFPDHASGYWLLNVVPFGRGSTASRTAWLFGQTTYDLSSMYCNTTGNERSFCPAICDPSAGDLTPKPSMVPPSGTSTS